MAVTVKSYDGIKELLYLVAQWVFCVDFPDDRPVVIWPQAQAKWYGLKQSLSQNTKAMTPARGMLPDA